MPIPGLQVRGVPLLMLDLASATEMAERALRLAEELV